VREGEGVSETCTKTEYCDTIRERRQVGRGMEVQTFRNVKTGKFTRHLVVHKLSAKDGGLVFNFCPWCGFDFSKRKDWPKPEEFTPGPSPDYQHSAGK
jgi:hypothetical protein